MTGVGGATTDAGAVDAGLFKRAHQALLARRDLQFDFGPPPTPHPPDWLKHLLVVIGRILVKLAPIFPVLFWVCVGLGLSFILFSIGREIIKRVRPGARKGKAAIADAPQPQWRPAQARALILLEEADRLAAEGRYGEAAHLILHRSVQDIDRRWPNLVRPALTSRDIAEHPALPDAARDAFSSLAGVVERHIFGGAQTDAAEFAACRAAYAAFALPSAP